MIIEWSLVGLDHPGDRSLRPEPPLSADRLLAPKRRLAAGAPCERQTLVGSPRPALAAHRQVIGVTLSASMPVSERRGARKHIAQQWRQLEPHAHWRNTRL